MRLATRIFVIISLLLNVYSLGIWLSISSSQDTQEKLVERYLTFFPFVSSAITLNICLFLLTLFSLFLMWKAANRGFWMAAFIGQAFFAGLYLWQSM